jgi:hypothetical protein
MLHMDPIDGAIGHVANQDIVRVVPGRQHRLRVLEQRRVPVVRIATEESVEVLEAQSRSPLVEGPVGALQPIGNQVVLAEPRRVVTVAHQNVADRSGVLGKDRIVPRVSSGELCDVAEAHAVVVAARKQRRPRG